MRIMLCLELSFVDPHQFLPLAGVLTEAVIGDTIKPGREFRLAAKASEIFVGAQKRFLSEVVRQSNVASRELPQKTADSGLVVTDQFSEGVMIVIEKDAGDEISII